MNDDLTDFEKTIIYNMVFDRYYSIIAQDISPEIRKEYLEKWEEDLRVILEKLKRQGWNCAYEETWKGV